MGHTFKVGDRVIGRRYQSADKNYGTFVTFDGKDCIIRRDDGKSGIEPGLYWYAAELIEHDRDFKVGDWVRYEGVNKDKTAHHEGKVGRIEGLDEWAADVSEFTLPRPMLDNLVKITPPKEEKVEKITIEHAQWGRVEGVVRDEPLSSVWEKEGALYCASKGWREVPKTKWVPVVAKGLGSNYISYDNSFDGDFEYGVELKAGYRWKTVEIEKEVENG